LASAVWSKEKNTNKVKKTTNFFIVKITLAYYTGKVNKITLALVVLVVLSLVYVWKILYSYPKASLASPEGISQAVKAVPSQTLKSYTDPSGFEFSYPDNLSLANNEATDSSTYADIGLTFKGVAGDLSLKIKDSKLKTIEEWAKSISDQTPIPAKLGTLQALELNLGEKIVLGSLDSGVLFTVETTFGDKKDFWKSIYASFLQDFSFAQPTKETTTSVDNSSDQGISFEGEEVVD